MADAVSARRAPHQRSGTAPPTLPAHPVGAQTHVAAAAAQSQSPGLLRRASSAVASFATSLSGVVLGGSGGVARVRSLDRFGFFLDSGDAHAGALAGAGSGASAGSGGGSGSGGVPEDPHAVRRRAAPAERQLENARTGKWLSLLADWDGVAARRPELLKRRLRKGVPDALRKVVWPRLSGGEAFRRAHPGLYASLLAAKPAREDEQCINVDLPRTYPNNFMFTALGGVAGGAVPAPLSEASALRPAGQLALGQAKLRNVLRAYACYNPSVGYCQGMGQCAAVAARRPQRAFRPAPPARL